MNRDLEHLREYLTEQTIWLCYPMLYLQMSHPKKRPSSLPPGRPEWDSIKMCTKTRIYEICPCTKPTCIDNGPICCGNGHVMDIDCTTRTVWDYCNWWFVNGPPELVLNSFVTPQCKNLGWDDLKIMSPEPCERCKKECR